MLKINPSYTMTTHNPCTSCGACCAHFRVSFYCGEIASTHYPNGVPHEFVSQLTPVLACMKGTELGKQRCCALQGELGQDSIRCTIYEHRPQPCRDFDPWFSDGTPNPDCQRLRQQIGLPELETLTPNAA